MISFKAFITESRLAPLYHGVQIRHLKSILENGLQPRTLQANKKLLKPSTAYNVKSRNTWLAHTGTPAGHIDEPDKTITGLHAGVSLTRSKPFADNWAGRDETKIVLELDQDALSRRYQIKPIQYWSSPNLPARKKDQTGTKNEYEEFVITDRPIPNKFIKRIHYKLIDSEEKRTWSPSTPSYDESREIINEMKKKYPHIQFVEIK